MKIRRMLGGPVEYPTEMAPGTVVKFFNASHQQEHVGTICGLPYAPDSDGPDAHLVATDPWDPEAYFPIRYQFNGRERRINKALREITFIKHRS